MEMKLLAGFFLCAVLSGSPVSASEPRLFFIQSYAPNSWTSGIREGALRSQKLRAMPLKEYYFDSDYWLKRGDLAHARDGKLTAFLSDLSSDDFVLISDDEAAAVVLPQILVSVPTVVLGINDAATSSAWNQFCETAKRRAVLFEDYPYERALDLAKTHFKGISEIHAIGSDTTTARAMMKGLSEYLKSRKRELSDQFASGDWSNWRERLHGWDRSGSLTWIFVPYGLRDSLNEEVDPALVSRWISENIKNARVGALGLGNAVDITIGLDPKDLGFEAAHLVEQILSGRRVSCRNASRSYKLAMNPRRVK